MLLSTSLLQDKLASQNKIVAWSKPMPLPALKLVARKNSSTINDVIVSLASGAIREYARIHNPEQLDSLKGIKAIIPVSLRSLKIKEKITLDNQVSCVFLEMPAEEEDIMQRLKKTKARMDNLKSSPDVLVTYVRSFVYHILINARLISYNGIAISKICSHS